MPVVNRLPSLSSEMKLVFIGGGWKQASGGNNYAITYRTFIDSEYFVEDGASIICQQNFKGYVVMTQGCTQDGSASDFGSLYNDDGDILKTPTGNYVEAHNIHDFTQGERITGWNQVGTNNVLSVRQTVIVAI